MPSLFPGQERAIFSSGKEGQPIKELRHMKERSALFSWTPKPKCFIAEPLMAKLFNGHTKEALLPKSKRSSISQKSPHFLQGSSLWISIRRTDYS
jgi:hypothetical protein